MALIVARSCTSLQSSYTTIKSPLSLPTDLSTTTIAIALMPLGTVQLLVLSCWLRWGRALSLAMQAYHDDFQVQRTH